MGDIGFIGLGIMGGAMCGRLLSAGYTVRAFDVDPAKSRAMTDKGAVQSPSPEDIARNCSTIILMVPASEHVESVVMELLPFLSQGSLIIDMSTISPVVSIRLADKVRARGSAMIDAPVVKSRAAAEVGELGILAGCDEALFERALPVLRCLGKEIIRMGPNGSGLAMKLCHNMLVAGIQHAVNEMLILAERCGLDFDLAHRAVSAGGGQNLFLDSKAGMLKKRDFSPRFPFEHMHKDLRLAKEFAAARGLSLEGAGLCLEVFAQGMEKGYARKDYAAALEVMERLADAHLND